MKPFKIIYYVVIVSVAVIVLVPISTLLIVNTPEALVVDEVLPIWTVTPLRGSPEALSRTTPSTLPTSVTVACPS